MLRFVVRFIALVCLSAACIMGVLDLARSLAANAPVFTPLATSWGQVAPKSFAMLKDAVETYTLPPVWDPSVTTVLGLPGFAVFAGLALLFYLLGHRPAARGRNRFARVS